LLCRKVLNAFIFVPTTEDAAFVILVVELGTKDLVGSLQPEVTRCGK